MPARSRLWPDPRVKPPYGAAEVNWAHPLASGLTVAWLFNEGAGTVMNLAQPWPGTLAGAATWTTTIFGPGMDLTGASACINAGDIPFDSNNWTLLIGLVTGTLSTYHRGIGWDNNGPQLWKGDTTLGIVHGGTVDYQAFGANLQSNERMMLALARSGSTASAVKNGQLIGTPGSISATYTTSGNVFRVGSGYGGSEFWPGRYEVAYAWGTRGLSVSEMQWVAAEPYSFLRPIVRRHVSIPAAGPAFQPAWAARSNVLIGAGRVA